MEQVAVALVILAWLGTPIVGMLLVDRWLRREPPHEAGAHGEGANLRRP